MVVLPKPDVTKLMSAARYRLQGLASRDPRYYDVLEVMEFAAAHHNGVRNDGEAEFVHQLCIFHNLLTQDHNLNDAPLAYMLAFSHDLIEDENQVTKAYINPEELRKWGEDFYEKTLKLSKKILGQPNPNYSLSNIFDDADCGPVKGADRVHNVSTMHGVFKPARLERYVLETCNEFLPRMKEARRKFPRQEMVYEAQKLQLVNQLQLIHHMLTANEVNAASTAA